MIHLIFIIFSVVNSFDFEKLSIDDQWELYKKTYKLKYKTIEDDQRKKIFLENKNYIDKHNSQKSSFKLEINQYAHLVIIILN